MLAYHSHLSKVWMDIGKEKDHIYSTFTTTFNIHTIDFAEDFLFTISSSCLNNEKKGKCVHKEKV